MFWIKILRRDLSSRGPLCRFTEIRWVIISHIVHFKGWMASKGLIAVKRLIGQLPNFLFWLPLVIASKKYRCKKYRKQKIPMHNLKWTSFRNKNFNDLIQGIFSILFFFTDRLPKISKFLKFIFQSLLMTHKAKL